MTHPHDRDVPAHNCPPPSRTIGDLDMVTLRDYVDTMFAEKEKALQAALLAQEKAVSAALSASDKAISKAEANAEKWRENANEWRGAMSDRDRELPSRREVEQALAALEATIKPISEWKTTQEGRREGIGVSVGMFVGSLTALGVVFAITLAIVALMP